jgi:hypothetical protein
MPNFTKLTPEKRSEFLDLLRESGNVSKTAEVIEISRVALYMHRKADPEFAAEWDEAAAIGRELVADDLEQAADNRAIEGVQEPILFQGEDTGHTCKRYSDNLLMFRLKALRPEKYCEKVRQEVTGKEGEPLTIQVKAIDYRTAIAPLSPADDGSEA